MADPSPPHQRWYFLTEKQEQVPTTEDQLPALSANGILRPQTLVWHPGQPDWVTAGELKPELFASLVSRSAGEPLASQTISSPPSVGDAGLTTRPGKPRVLDREKPLLRFSAEAIAKYHGWMKFTSVLTFLASLSLLLRGLMALVLSLRGAKVGALEAGAMLAFFSLLDLVLAAMLLTQGIFLMRASMRLRSAQLHNDSEEFQAGLGDLGKYFLILGLLSILTLIRLAVPLIRELDT